MEEKEQRGMRVLLLTRLAWRLRFVIRCFLKAPTGRRTPKDLWFPRPATRPRLGNRLAERGPQGEGTARGATFVIFES